MSRGHYDWQPWTAVQRFAGTGGAAIFEQEISVEKSADGETATEGTQEIMLDKGFIAHVQIRFPTGPCGLLSISIFDELEQLWPGTADTFFTGDNEVIEFDCEEDVPLVNSDYKVTIHGENLDDAYAHGALVRIWVVKLPA